MISFIHLFFEENDTISTQNISTQPDPYADIKAKVAENFKENPQDYQRDENGNWKYNPTGWGATQRALKWYGQRTGRV